MRGGIRPEDGHFTTPHSLQRSTSRYYTHTPTLPPTSPPPHLPLTHSPSPTSFQLSFHPLPPPTTTATTTLQAPFILQRNAFLRTTNKQTKKIPHELHFLLKGKRVSFLLYFPTHSTFPLQKKPTLGELPFVQNLHTPPPFLACGGSHAENSPIPLSPLPLPPHTTGASNSRVNKKQLLFSSPSSLPLHSTLYTPPPTSFHPPPPSLRLPRF